MKCAKCDGTMNAHTYGRKITVHRCDTCAGLFCKPDVLVEMKKEWMSEAVLDVGDPKVGSKLDKVADIHCPECDSVMEKTADEKQSHIWYEVCPNCDGLWLDAGEFTDLKFDTLMDRLRSLVKGKRPDA